MILWFINQALKLHFHIVVDHCFFLCTGNSGGVKREAEWVLSGLPKRVLWHIVKAVRSYSYLAPVLSQIKIGCFWKRWGTLTNMMLTLCTLVNFLFVYKSLFSNSLCTLAFCLYFWPRCPVFRSVLRRGGAVKSLYLLRVSKGVIFTKSACLCGHYWLHWFLSSPSAMDVVGWVYTDVVLQPPPYGCSTDATELLDLLVVMSVELYWLVPQ